MCSLLYRKQFAQNPCSSFMFRQTRPEATPVFPVFTFKSQSPAAAADAQTHGAVLASVFREPESKITSQTALSCVRNCYLRKVPLHLLFTPSDWCLQKVQHEQTVRSVSVFTTILYSLYSIFADIFIFKYRQIFPFFTPFLHFSP